MANQDLSLPVDIPWKRLAASADMMATQMGTYPPKWRPSIAIFYHEVDNEADGLPASYCDRKITYLKISCSITGYQIDQKEVDFQFDSANKDFFSVPVTVRARGTKAAGEWPLMALTVNGAEIGEWRVEVSDAFNAYT